MALWEEKISAKTENRTAQIKPKKAEHDEKPKRRKAIAHRESR
jgi:hypothetical protein